MLDVVKSSHKIGALFAFGVAARVLYITISFFIAVEVIVYRLELDANRVYQSTFVLFYSFLMVGHAASAIPSVKNAKASAVPIFSIIDEPSTLDIRKTEGRDIKHVEHGKIELIDVNFNYPTRAEKVMDNFNIEIPAGAKIALVGHSGCGKSTLTNLLLGFYNVEDG